MAFDRNTYAKEWIKAKRRKNPEWAKGLSQLAREWQKRNPVRFALTNSKKGAKNRGHAWSLPDSLAVDLITDCCFYCGADPTPTNGIDRVDNRVGYIEGNVVTACRDCNYGKREQTADAFIEWARRVASRFAEV